MDLYFVPYLLIFLLVVGTPSHFISALVYRKWWAAGRKGALGMYVLSFVVSFAIIGFLLLWIIFSTFRFER